MGLHSIYIDSEHTFSSMRLLNMIGGFDSQREQLLELVRTETIFDSESLLNILKSIENEFEEQIQNNANDQLPVLLIIDSIAAPLRMSMMNYTRENILLLLTDCLKRLARKYNLLILGNTDKFLLINSYILLLDLSDESSYHKTPIECLKRKEW